jgi:hypothetical protein
MEAVAQIMFIGVQFAAMYTASHSIVNLLALLATIVGSMHYHHRVSSATYRDWITDCGRTETAARLAHGVVVIHHMIMVFVTLFLLCVAVLVGSPVGVGLAWHVAVGHLIVSIPFLATARRVPSVGNGNGNASSSSSSWSGAMFRCGGLSRPARFSMVSYFMLAPLARAAWHGNGALVAVCAAALAVYGVLPGAIARSRVSDGGGRRETIWWYSLDAQIEIAIVGSLIAFYFA